MNFMKNFRFNSVKKCYGLQLHYSFSSSVVKFPFLESWVLNQLIHSIGFVLSWPQTVVPWWNSVSPQLSLPVWLCNFWLVQKLLKLAIHQKNGKTSKIMSQEKWLIKYLVLYSLVPRNFSVWLWLLVKLLSMYWLVCTVIQLKWELVSVVWSLSNFLLLDSLFCFLTNFFQRYDSFYYTVDSYCGSSDKNYFRVMVLDLVFHFSSPPISVKPSSGKHSPQLPSMLVVVLNSKEPSLPFSTFWPPRMIKFVPSMKPFTDPTCQTWWISWPPLLFSLSSSTSKVLTSPLKPGHSWICNNEKLRIPCRLAHQVCPIPRSILNLPNQALLHFKHPNYSPIRPRLQLVCHLTNVVNTILRKLFRFSFGRLGCCKYYFKIIIHIFGVNFPNKIF